MKKQIKDPYYNLKYIGYSRALLNPEHKDYTLGEFLDYCQFYLCRKLNIPFKDPIWSEYTNEELMVEYFAHYFLDNETARVDFEDLFKNDLYSWMEEEAKKANLETEEKLNELPDSFSFEPAVGD